MSKIIVAGQELDGELPQLRTWNDRPYWNAASECPWTPTAGACTPAPASSPLAKNPSTRRYAYRPALARFHREGRQPPLDAARAVIDKFVLHHDGCPDAAACWRTLHNERGLSCHFLIDGDGTIYQTCDLALMAYHAAQFNLTSIGVELNNRGDARKEPSYYRDRRTVTCQIGPSRILAWDYTDAQYASLHELARVLVRHLPNLPLEFPQDPAAPGKQLWGVMAPDAAGESTGVPGYAGYLGHYHCTKRKWDPGAFDFKRFIGRLRRTRVYPMWPGTAPADEDARPAVATEVAAIAAQAAPYYERNERDAGGGFYPVGPWGVARIWHGGIHLPADERAPVFAPFAGRVVAARSGSATPIGSGDFVLTRHDLVLGARTLRFWMLAMHLADDGPAWSGGRVIDGVRILDEPVDAGARIGRVGVVGPEGLARPQLHLEIFARTHLFADDASAWTVVDGTAGGRLCEVDAIDELIDADHDHRLSRQELADFYAGNPAREDVRAIVSYNVSEWTEEPDWTTSLEVSMADFRKRSARRKGRRAADDDDDEDLDVRALVDEQLRPFLWWTADVAAALGLPSDGVVYHYHPIRFIEWVNARLAAGAADAPPVPVDATAAVDTRVVQGDIDDVAGDAAYVDLDAPDPDDAKVDLRHLADGFAGEGALFP